MTSDLVNSGRYTSRIDSAVVLLTSLHNLKLPIDQGLGLKLGVLPKISLLPDLSYLAPNCFHPSQKFHSKSNSTLYSFHHTKLSISVTLTVWNSFIQSNTSLESLADQIICPSIANPFFDIDQNSLNKTKK